MLAIKLQPPPLTVIKGYKNSSILAQTTLAAWHALYAILYNGCTFSSAEIDASKALIRQHLLQAPDAEAEYINMVQRILLTRRYLSGNSSRYVPTPAKWLDPQNANGFTGTETWFSNLETFRQKQPLFKITYKAFAEAILEMAIEPTATNFHYWRSYFIERNANTLANLFLATIAISKFPEP